jgi:hypothetical protein
MRGLLHLRSRNLHQEIEYQRYLMEEAQEEEDFKKATQYGRTMVQLTQVKRQIDLALDKYTGRSPIVHSQA